MAKDRKIDMVILGILAHENSTGYDIKKRIDGGISYFWKGSFGSIYPALSAMEKEGLVLKLESDSSQGGREKIFYQITESGREALLNWLREDKVTNDLKYETILKVFFGGITAPEITLQTIDNFENEISESLEVLNRYKAILSQILDERDHIHYYLAVTFGIETYEGYLRWCKDAKELLKV